MSEQNEFSAIAQTTSPFMKMIDETKNEKKEDQQKITNYDISLQKIKEKMESHKESYRRACSVIAHYEKIEKEDQRKMEEARKSKVIVF